MKGRLSYFGGILTAFLSASCCIGPFLFIAFGVTGFGFLARLGWLRPYLLLFTFIFVGIAYYYFYGKGSKCYGEESCNPKARLIDRILFWVLVGFAIFGLSFPYATNWLLK